MTDPTDIQSYHAHVYFADDESRERARVVREGLADSFEVVLGRWHEGPVGPHPSPMYQVAFAVDTFASLVPWLMLSRRGLTVLVHPNTGDDLGDHRDRALWMGQVLTLNLAVLEKRKAP